MIALAALGVAVVAVVAFTLGGHNGSPSATSVVGDAQNPAFPGSGSGAGGGAGSGAGSGSGSDTTSDSGLSGQSQVTAPSTQDSPSYPALSLSGKECGRVGDGPYAAGAAANDHTSCPFVMNVREQYVASGANGSPTSITAFSPVTNTTYTMQCTGNQPVTCVGGNDAVVYVYGGTASFSG